MITTFIKKDKTVVAYSGLPDSSQNYPIVWLKVNAPTEEEAQTLRDRYAIDIKPRFQSVVDEANNIYMRTELLTADKNGNAHFRKINFILGENFVTTVDLEQDTDGIDHYLYRLNRKAINHVNSRATLRVLLQISNDVADSIIDKIADELDLTAKDISDISDGFSPDGKELGVGDLVETMRGLNNREELISHCVEAQLSLMRAVRYLNAEVDNTTEPELQGLVDELTGDVAGVKEHAYFEYEKVRYLQNAVTNILNIKQNQIVKIFTIITAVFLPPTLVGTFYGMNFAVMPELSWENGFIYSLMLTLMAALMPLLYIKYKGWLR